ncbi:MAG: hypothetical protein JXA42_04400 [Anaerolineales bacterium]|nr:hypothetical protein [Anaerolineales bacterium]
MKTINGPIPDVTVQSQLPRAILNRIIGRALLDPVFCEMLLNGSRGKILHLHAEELSAEQRAYVMSVRAATINEFARALVDEYPADDGGQGEPPPSTHSLL